LSLASDAVFLKREDRPRKERFFFFPYVANFPCEAILRRVGPETAISTIPAVLERVEVHLSDLVKEQKAQSVRCSRVGEAVDAGRTQLREECDLTGRT
jgi:hypothetical protein